MGRAIVMDSEADGLDPTRVWCIVTKEWPSGVEKRYTLDECYTKFPKDVEDVDTFIAHNAVGYEWRKIFPLLGMEVPLDKIVDTLVLSQLENPMLQDAYGKHSLDAWGWRLGIQKPKHDEWDKFSPEMLERCVQDVRINFKLFKLLARRLHGFSKESSRIEHATREYLDTMRETGWKLNVQKATALHSAIHARLVELQTEIQRAFPPQPKKEKLVKPKFRKSDGQMSAQGLTAIKHWLQGGPMQRLVPTAEGYVEQGFDVLDVVGGPYTQIGWHIFNPKSNPQVIKLMDKYGWKPTIPTKSKKSWKICEENLNTLPADAPAAVHLIPEFLVASDRVTTIQGWLKAAGPDERVRSWVLGMGTYTHRGSSANPNLANVPTASNKSRWGVECRDVWTVDDPVERVIKENGSYRFEGKGSQVLLGADAAGIQLRIFIHLTGGSDPDYVAKMLDDPHSTNLDLLGIDKGPFDPEENRYTIGRQKAKRFFYAFLLGSGVGKSAEILEITQPRARTAVTTFVDNTPGLKELKFRFKRYADIGWMKLCDGRRVRVPSAHLAMGIALQGNEAVIMKRAMTWWLAEMRQQKIRALPVGWIHDEVQNQTHKDEAVYAGERMVHWIRATEDHFKLKCPMDGDFKIGTTWKETH